VGSAIGLCRVRVDAGGRGFKPLDLVSQEGEAESGDGSLAGEDESDSDVSVVSDEDVPSSKIRKLVQEAKQQKKKRRLN
jgi:hypothetical protein